MALCLMGSVCAAVQASPLLMSSASFYEKVSQSAENWLVLFRVSWCGACQAFSPEWLALTESWQGRTRLGEVDAESEAYLADHYGVHSYPALLDIRGGRFIFYSGDRTAASISAYLLRSWTAEETERSQPLHGPPSLADHAIRWWHMLASQIVQVGDVMLRFPLAGFLFALAFLLLGMAIGKGPHVHRPASFLTVTCPVATRRGEILKVELPRPVRWWPWRNGVAHTMLVTAPTDLEPGGTFFVPLVSIPPVEGHSTHGKRGKSE